MPVMFRQKALFRSRLITGKVIKVSSRERTLLNQEEICLEQCQTETTTAYI